MANKKLKLELFLHMQQNLLIIWTRIDQVIWLRNYIFFSKTTCTFQMISNFLKHLVFILQLLNHKHQLAYIVQ